VNRDDLWGTNCPAVKECGKMAKELSDISKFVVSYWNYYLELEEAFKQTHKYVAFDKHNERTYSVEYLKLIQAVCSEIDVVAKEISQHFDPGFCVIKRPNISHWGYVIINNMPQITKVCVSFTSDYVVRPWEKFGYTKYIDKNGSTRYKLLPDCTQPSWWNDYNKMKHQRTSRSSDGEINFIRANLKNMVLSLAALFSMEMLYMDIITPEIGSDCYIEESQLFTITCCDSIDL
jgi:hypothetical protein